MPSAQDAFENDACPVGDNLLGQLYRASPQGLPDLVASVPGETRAMLALFCYKRSHLHDMAIAIASSCERRDLIEWGGALGSALYSMSRQAGPVAPAAETSNRRRITLSTKPLSTFAPLDDSLDDEALVSA